MATQTIYTPRYVRKRKFKRMNRQQKLDRISWILAWFSVAIVVAVSLVNFDQEATQQVILIEEVNPSFKVYTLNITDNFKPTIQPKTHDSSNLETQFPTRSYDNLDDDSSTPDEDPLSFLWYNQEVVEEEPIPVEINVNYSGSGQMLELSRLDFALLCHFVIHEAGQSGMSEGYYVGNPDIDFMQKCIGATAINRIKSSRSSEKTVLDTLLSDGFFGLTPYNTKEKLLQYLFGIDSVENDLEKYLYNFENNDICYLTQNKPCTRTKQNVMSLLTGDTVLPTDLIFEMGWKFYDSNGNLITDLDYIQVKMEERLGRVEIIYSCITIENYVCTLARKIGY